MSTLISSIKKDGIDTGVRTNYRGAMFVDKKVYFNRKEVKINFEKLRDKLIVKKK
ncbi:hypothetical protein [Flagellimonas oceanensis]|uniref:hypothetical protein n=1 Tax=Flagellimonas oceanensis TaxID=2499163 RepID=UPI0013E087DE|nr:hypothetical protein [Allomuricauda oceanensis]